jgi:hypothetical protein
VADTSIPRAPRLDDFPGEVAEDLLALYRNLGGVQQAPTLRPGAWDLSFDGILVELDEELHFNRYRRVTLESHFGATAPWASEYLNACVRHESDCLRAGQWGARWTSTSSAGMFGRAAEAGDLASAGGAPRWKQRAMYDAMKDAAALTLARVQVARLSVWDDVESVRLGDALKGRNVMDIAALSRLFAARTTQYAD